MLDQCSSRSDNIRIAVFCGINVVHLKAKTTARRRLPYLMQNARSFG